MEYQITSGHHTRKAILASYNLLEPTNDTDYEQITFLAASICKVPVAYISILNTDHIWFKAAYGIDIPKKIAIEGSFFETLMDTEEKFYTTVLSENPELFERAKRIYGNRYKFYAGLPIVDDSGFLIGVLNILDIKEKTLNSNQITALKALANQTLKLFEFRRQNSRFEKVQKNLKEKYQELDKFASLVSHDLKSPLANIISLTELLKEENKGKLDQDTQQYLDYLVESSYSLRNYVDGILGFYRSEHVLNKEFETVTLQEVLKDIKKLYEVEEGIYINFPKDCTLQKVNKSALSQIFLNLVSNALKYNSKECRKVEITCEENPNWYSFEVIDNGDGFNKKDETKIFELFTTLETNDRKGNPGSGIGLATVKKLVENLGGTINVSSTPGQGSNFTFTIKRV